MARPKGTSTPTARSSPRLSSAQSTPTSSSRKAKSEVKPSTPLKQSVSSKPTKGKWIEKSAKTSPYFHESKGKSTPASASNGKAKGKGKAAASKGRTKVETNEDDDSEDEATGMTESEQDSSSDDGGSEDDFDPSSNEDEEEAIEDDEQSLDSDYLDEDNTGAKRASAQKRKSNGVTQGKQGSAKKAKTNNGSAVVKSKGGNGSSIYVEGYEDEDEDEEDDVELEEGQELAGRIYPAPKTGQVPPGRLSQNTLNFLKNLQIPERNDREWFRSHEPAFRQAEKEWKSFVGIVQMRFHEADDEVPILPPKDIIHRIYRDVRFSSDKTPYKRNFSMSTSRGGRKGVWAAYHLSISPNNRSLIAAGVWQPGKNELATIRHHLLADPQRFRDVIGAEEFVELFGEAKEKKGKRQNVFGNDDALKVAPKGVDKDHKDIDLLKLRSVAVVHHLSDEQVIAEDFQDQLYDILTKTRPFVRMLNDFIALPPGTGNDHDNDNDNNASGAAGNEDDDEDD